MTLKKEFWEEKWIDCYKLFNVSYGADLSEIKKSYYMLLKKYHPDNNPENEENAKEMTIRINEIMQMFSDSNRRKDYDQAYQKNRYLSNLSATKKSTSSSSFQKEKAYWEKHKRRLPKMIEKRKADIIIIENKIKSLIQDAYDCKVTDDEYCQMYDKLVINLSMLEEDLIKLKNGAYILKMINEMTRVDGLVVRLTKIKTSIPDSRVKAARQEKLKRKKRELFLFTESSLKSVESITKQIMDLKSKVINGSISDISYRSETKKLASKIKIQIKNLKQQQNNCQIFSMSLEAEKLEEMIVNLEKSGLNLQKTFTEIKEQGQLDGLNIRYKNLISKIELIDNQLQSMGNIFDKEYLDLTYTKIEYIAKREALKNYIEQIFEIKTPLDKEMITIICELKYLTVKNSELSKEIVSLEKRLRLNQKNAFIDIYISKYTEEKENLYNEIMDKKLKMAVLYGIKEKEEYLEEHSTDILFDKELVLHEANKKKIKRQLKELCLLERERTEEYLNLKLDLCREIYEVVSRRHLRKNMHTVTSFLEDEILYLTKENNGLIASIKALKEEECRIYGYYSFSALNYHELNQITVCKNTIDDLEHLLENNKDKLMNLKVENLSKYKLDLQMIDFKLKELEEKDEVRSSEYLVLKTERMDLSKNIVSTQYYANYFNSNLTDCEKKRLRIIAELEGERSLKQDVCVEKMRIILISNNSLNDEEKKQMELLDEIEKQQNDIIATTTSKVKKLI